MVSDHLKNLKPAVERGEVSFGGECLSYLDLLSCKNFSMNFLELRLHLLFCVLFLITKVIVAYKLYRCDVLSAAVSRAKSRHVWQRHGHDGGIDGG